MEDFTIVIEDLLGNNQFAFFCILDGHGGSMVSKYLKESYPIILKDKIKNF